MLAEYTFYHGALLHELTLSHQGRITIEPRTTTAGPILLF